MKQIFAISLTILLTGCFGPSAEQKQRAETACEKFVLEKIGEYGDESHIFDTYSKDGAIVVEVGYRARASSWRRDDDSYSVRVCVYDEEEGTIQIPSLFNMGQWKK